VGRARRWIDLLVVLAIVADLFAQTRVLLHTEPFRRHPVSYDASVGAVEKFLRVGDVDTRAREAWIAGYLNLYDRRFDAFTPAPLVVDRYLRYHQSLVKKPFYGDLAAGAIGFTLTRFELPPPFVPIARDHGVIVYRSDYPAPMAVHISREPLGMRRAEWSVDTSTARVSVDAPHDGVLVLRQQAASGWRATIDGKPSPSLVIDGVYRGVNLSRGRHEVVWTYRPNSLLFGAAMTLITLASLQVLVFVKRT
jgi:hypothetical protein